MYCKFSNLFLAIAFSSMLVGLESCDDYSIDEVVCPCDVETAQSHVSELADAMSADQLMLKEMQIYNELFFSDLSGASQKDTLYIMTKPGFAASLGMLGFVLGNSMSDDVGAMLMSVAMSGSAFFEADDLNSKCFADLWRESAKSITYNYYSPIPKVGWMQCGEESAFAEIPRLYCESAIEWGKFLIGSIEVLRLRLAAQWLVCDLDKKVNLAFADSDLSSAYWVSMQDVMKDGVFFKEDQCDLLCTTMNLFGDVLSAANSLSEAEMLMNVYAKIIDRNSSISFHTKQHLYTMLVVGVMGFDYWRGLS